MKIQDRLRYLLEEGFEVLSVSGYDAEREDDPHGTATLLYRVRNDKGQWRLRSEHFEASYDDLQETSRVFVQGLHR